MAWWWLWSRGAPWYDRVWHSGPGGSKDHHGMVGYGRVVQGSACMAGKWMESHKGEFALCPVVCSSAILYNQLCQPQKGIFCISPLVVY